MDEKYGELSWDEKYEELGIIDWFNIVKCKPINNIPFL
jgi:hypothetical protein